MTRTRGLQVIDKEGGSFIGKTVAEGIAAVGGGEILGR